MILAAIHYLRFVEKETNTPPRELKILVSQSGKWEENDVEKWNLSLYINRMLEGGSLWKETRAVSRVSRRNAKEKQICCTN